MTDNADVLGLSGAVPGKPLKGQKTPPCTGKQVRINEGCWRALEDKPDKKLGCEDSYEHQGKCYVPVMASKPLTSLEP